MQNNVIIERVCCEDRVNAVWMDMGFICIFAFAKQSDALQLLVQIKQTLTLLMQVNAYTLIITAGTICVVKAVRGRCECVDESEMN